MMNLLELGLHDVFLSRVILSIAFILIFGNVENLEKLFADSVLIWACLVCYFGILARFLCSLLLLLLG